MSVDLIGCGYWGSNYVRELSKMNILKNIYDKDLILANTISERYSVKFVNNIDELIKDKAKILFICSSVDSHFELLEKLIPHYSYIFCEKPIVNDINHLKILLKLVNQYNCSILTGHILLFHDSIQFLFRYFKENKILDKIKRIKCFRKSFGKVRSYENVVESFGIHDLSIIHKFIDSEVTKIESLTDSCLSLNNIDVSDIYLTFSNKKKLLFTIHG